MAKQTGHVAKSRGGSTKVKSSKQRKHSNARPDRSESSGGKQSTKEKGLSAVSKNKGKGVKKSSKKKRKKKRSKQEAKVDALGINAAEEPAPKATGEIRETKQRVSKRKAGSLVAGMPQFFCG